MGSYHLTVAAMKLVALSLAFIASAQAGALDQALEQVVDLFYKETPRGFKVQVPNYYEGEYTKTHHGGKWEESWNAHGGDGPNNEVEANWGQGFLTWRDKGYRVNVADNPFYWFGNVEGWTSYDYEAAYRMVGPGLSWDNKFSIDGNTFNDRGHAKLSKFNPSSLEAEIEIVNNPSSNNIGYWSRFVVRSPMYHQLGRYCTESNNYCHDINYKIRAKANRPCKRSPFHPGCVASIGGRGQFGVSTDEWSLTMSSRVGSVKLTCNSGSSIKVDFDRRHVAYKFSTQMRSGGDWQYHATIPGPGAKNQIRRAVIELMNPIMSAGMNMMDDPLAHALWFDEYDGKFDGRFDCSSIVRESGLDIPAMGVPDVLYGMCEDIDDAINDGISVAGMGARKVRFVLQDALSKQNDVRAAAGQV